MTQTASRPLSARIAAIGAAALLLALVAGCSSEGSDTTPTDEPEVTTDASDEVTTEEAAEGEPTEEESDEPAEVDEVAAFEDRIMENYPGGSWGEFDIAPADVSGQAITVTSVYGDTVDLQVQEALTEDEKIAVGRWMFNMSGQEDYTTFVVTDTSGLDQNVFCSASSKLCADSIWDI